MSHEKNYCQFCGSLLSPGREFVFQVEDLHFQEQFAGHPEVLARIRAAPGYHGEPLRTCQACYVSLEENTATLADERQQQLREMSVTLKTLAWMAAGFVLLTLASW